LRSGPATRTTPNPGSGAAASILDPHPGECRSGTAASLDEARAGFEAAWRTFLANRTEADFQEWRDQRDWTARKYALLDAGKRLEPPSYGPGKPCSKFMRCVCGEVFAMYEPAESQMHVPHLSASQASRRRGNRLGERLG
jgi:hypothetical protein